VFLCGGGTLRQAAYLKETGLNRALCAFEGVVIGLSAGAINMGKTSLCSKDADNETTVVYSGLGLADLTVEPHFDPDNRDFIETELYPLSDRLRITALRENGGARVCGKQITYFGTVCLIHHRQLHILHQEVL